ERSLETSNTANETAARAAKAAEDAVKLTEQSMDLDEDTAIRELRAYLSIMGTDLRFDRQNNRLVSTITIENTGRTPAHEVEVYFDVLCNDRIGGKAQNRRLPHATEPIPAVRSIGPRGKFIYEKHWELGSANAQSLGRTMDMWIWGQVRFND